MIKLEKKQVKIVSILIAVIFIGSVVALALTQTGNVALAASSSNVGVVEYDQILVQHPDMQSFDDQMKSVVDEVKKEFDEKSAGMNDQEKADYYRQCQERILQKREQLLKLLAMNNYDMEANSRQENLVAFKAAYGRSISNIRGILSRFISDMTEDEIQGFIYAFFPFLFGIYPYSVVTDKQKKAMKDAGVDFKYQTIYKITFNCLIGLLSK